MDEDRFRFWRQWREYDQTRVLRDYATVHEYGSFQQASQMHARAVAGGWVSGLMVDPFVSALYEVRGGLREVRSRPSRDLPMVEEAA